MTWEFAMKVYTAMNRKEILSKIDNKYLVSNILIVNVDTRISLRVSKHINRLAVCIDLTKENLTIKSYFTRAANINA